MTVEAHDDGRGADGRSADLTDDLGRAIGELTEGERDRGAIRRVATVATRSMKAAGARSVATGKWLADAVLAAAPHIPVRDLATLRAHHHGLEGPELAGALIRSATRATAGLGAVAGALAGAEELAPPTWLALPAEIVVETLLVVAVEMKLVAELHEVYGRPVHGSLAVRGTAVARAWAEGRGVRTADLTSAGGVTQALGLSTRRELTRLLQRRLARRTLRNMSALAPFLAGAVAGAAINRRATRAVGEAVVRDLARR
jgi:uncharacterized protein (DUF697 family)